MRLVFTATLTFLAAAGVHAAEIGITANGSCIAGSCPAVPIPPNTSDSVSFNSTVSLANGDTFLVFGSFSGSNGSNSFSTGHDFEVLYEGNAAGGPSAADTITVDASYLFDGSGTDVFNRDVIGAFGSTIASSSSASSCVNVTLGCTGVLTPPGSFSVSSSFPLSASGGVFSFDPSFVDNFGAGSPVGSFIVWGQTAALPTPTPEPGTLSLIAAGLCAVGAGCRRSRRRTTRASAH